MMARIANRNRSQSCFGMEITMRFRDSLLKTLLLDSNFFKISARNVSCHPQMHFLSFQMG